MTLLPGTMSYLFEITHPKHFYLFRALIEHYRERGEAVVIIARDKDVVLPLLREHGYPFQIYGPHGKRLFAKVLAVPEILVRYSAIVWNTKPRAIFSKGSPYSAVVAKCFGVKAVMFPDSDIPSSNNFVLPLSSLAITPSNYRVSYGDKHRRVEGLLESCYLHPHVFQPDRSVLTELRVEHDEPYAVLRFVGWTANHDALKKGFSPEQKREIVEVLSRHLRVFISSEGPLPPSLQQFQLQTPASRIHHVLAFASLYLGDSQSMATESALVGTPAVRMNSYVGANDMSNFQLLENTYGLLHNHSDYEKALADAIDLVTTPGTKAEWQRRRDRYFAATGDVNAQIIDYVSGL